MASKLNPVLSKPYKIIIIDDDKILLKMLEAKILKVANYPIVCETYLTAKEGFESMKSSPANIIIVDYMLGNGEYGDNVISTIKSLSPSVITIGISASTRSLTTALQMFTQGATAFLPKPIDLKKLTTIIERSLEHFNEWELCLRQIILDNRKKE